MPNVESRVMGIDASLRSTGVGIVEARGSSLKAVAYDTIQSPGKAPLSECLRRLDERLTALIERTEPGAAAVETAFFHRNVRTAMILGQVRGVAIAACARGGVPVYEYEPRRVKQAVVGFGGADKQQVRKMIMRLLRLREEPQEDAGDALAVAICHLHGRSRHDALGVKPI